MTDDILHPPVFINICIYHRADPVQGVYQGYLGNTCEEASQGWYLVDRFYAINPMFIPLPNYLKLICAKKSNSGEQNYNTLKVSDNYDPFDINSDCVYFATWTKPTPFTTPLYLYESGGGVLPSFEKRKLKESVLSPLYVLTSKPKPNTVFPPDKEGTWFDYKDNKTPDFLFQDVNGVCLPMTGNAPNIVPFEQCVLNHVINNQKPMSLLDYIAQNPTNLTTSVNSEPVFPSFLSENIFSSIVLAVVLISIGIIVVCKITDS